MRNADVPRRRALEQYRDVRPRCCLVLAGQVDEPPDAGVEKRVDPGDTLRSDA